MALLGGRDGVPVQHNSSQSVFVTGGRPSPFPPLVTPTINITYKALSRERSLNVTEAAPCWWCHRHSKPWHDPRVNKEQALSPRVRPHARMKGGASDLVKLRLHRLLFFSSVRILRHLKSAEMRG